MGLEELPPEILYAISQDVVAFGPSHLVGLTRVSRRLHAIFNAVLYSTDVRDSGGLRSMYYGLKSGLNNVVKLCLSGGADPNLRFESCKDLDSYFPSVSQAHFNQPGESDDVEMHFPEAEFHFENGRNARSPSLSENPSRQEMDWNFNPILIGRKPFLSKKTFYWTPLHVGATRGDSELLSLLLDYGANPKSAGRGVCPCHYLPVRRTFGRHLPPDEQTDLWNPQVLERRLVTRWSPLHVAVCKGNLDCAEQLISRLGLAKPPESDESVLAEAQQFFREEEILVPVARFNRDILSGITPRLDPLSPLHVAADKYASVEDLARLYAILEQAGSPHSAIDVLDAFGDTPLAVAAFSGRIQIFGTWLRDHGADTNQALLDTGGERRSILNALCKSGLYKDALSLMDLNVDINKDTELHSGGRHESTLHICCGHGLHRDHGPMLGQKLKHREAIVLIKRLMQSGADINTKAEDGTTALISAAAFSFAAAVRELLEAKADIRAEDIHGNSALHHAIAHSLSLPSGPHLRAAIAVIKLLLDAGADPNQSSERNGPPLFRRQYHRDYKLAVMREDFEAFSTGYEGQQNAMVFIAPLLIARGADPNHYIQDRSSIGEGSLEEQLQNLRGRSLAVSAFYSGEFDALDSLVACGTVVTRQDYLLMMRSLIDENVRSAGNTSRAVEALFRVLNCPSLRLEQPGDRKDILDAWTEVLYRAVGSRPKLVKALARHIYLTDIRGPGGENVLHLVAQWEQKSHEKSEQFNMRINEVMTNLLRCGAVRQIDQPDNKGRSPLYVAVDHGNVYVAKKLVEFGASLHTDHRNPDGSTTMSPLKYAIKSYSKVRQFKVAVEMLRVFHLLHGVTDRVFWNLGLLKDLILHFGDSAFDELGHILSRTTKLLQLLFDIGLDLNESDEQGNTVLHHLIQLLCPWKQSSNDPENLQDVCCPPPLIYAANGSESTIVSVRNSADTSQERLSESPEEQNIRTSGHNLKYDSDSDYGYDPHNDRIDSEVSSDDESDSSDDGNGQESLARNERGESVWDRCSAWISSFFFLLHTGASLTTRNNAGKTVLDYIDELRGCQPHTCPELYRPIIPALTEFVKRTPFDPELLAQLDDSLLKAKGQPLVCVHGNFLFSMDEDIEELRESQTRAMAQSKWVPFW